MPKLIKFLGEFLQRRSSTAFPAEKEGRLERDAVVIKPNCDHNGNIQVPSVGDEEERSSRAESLQLQLEEEQSPREAGEINEFRVPFGQQQQILMQFSNVKKLHLGSVYNFQNLGSAETDSLTSNSEENERKRQRYRKTKSIVAMMEDQTEPNYRILDAVATHLGRNWKSLMRELGFSEGQIAQAFIDHHLHGQMKEVSVLIYNRKEFFH